MIWQVSRVSALSALLLACAGKAISIGANPSGSGGSPTGSGRFIDGGSPSVGGLGGTSGGVDPASLGGATFATGGVAVDGSGGLGVGAGGGVAIEPARGCATQLASGDSHLCVLYDDGHVACLGDNSRGQLGEPRGTPSSLQTIAGIHAALLTAGGNHNCAATDRGVECWGDNSEGQLGVTTLENIASKPVLTFAPALASIQLASGSGWTCSLDGLWQVYCWGSLGPDEPWRPTLHRGLGAQPQQRLVAGASTPRFIVSDRLFNTNSRPAPGGGPSFPIRGATAGVVANAMGADHDCILKRSGTVWCRTTFIDSNPYNALTELGTDIAEVKVGSGFLCARTAGGEVRCLGSSERGQLGGERVTSRGTGLVAIPVVAGAIKLSLGLNHACALMEDGSVRCWGALHEIEFGAQPTTISQPDPDAGCAPSSLRFLGEDEPISRPADEYADSALAWAQEACRMIDAVQLGTNCLSEQTRVLNGCLQSLAGTDEGYYSSCAGAALWEAAYCVATSGGDPVNVAICAPGLDVCGYPSQAISFCARSQITCASESSAEQVVWSQQICDGTADCVNGFDEANCDPDMDSLVCPDGTVVSLDAFNAGEVVCNGGPGR